MTARLAAVAICVLLNFAWMSFTHAQNVLTQPFSPEAIGRGDIYPSTTTDDPLSTMANPGFLGFLAERNLLTVGFYPVHQTWEWYPGENMVGYASRAIVIGIDHTRLGKYFDIETPFSFGLGYQETELQFPESDMHDANGHYLYSYRPYEKSRGFTLGFGYQSTCLQLGAGLNHKFIKEAFGTSNGSPYHRTATDIGIVLQSAMEKYLWKHDSSRVWMPSLVPMIAYTISNIGPEYRYGYNTSSSPLPQAYTVGLNLKTGIRTRLIANGQIEAISLAVGEQLGGDLVRYNRDGGHYYQNPFGRLKPINDLILGKTHKQVTRKQGIEVCALETVSARWGHVKLGNETYSSNYQNTTSGYGLRLAGLLKLLESTGTVHASRWADMAMHHLDIQYNYGTRFSDGGYSSYQDGTEYHEITVLWRK